MNKSNLPSLSGFSLLHFPVPAGDGVCIFQEGPIQHQRAHQDEFLHRPVEVCACTVKTKSAFFSGLHISSDTVSVFERLKVILRFSNQVRLLLSLSQRFTGHATAVSTLCFISTRPPTHDMEGLYFLSGAAHDRLLSVWQVRSDGKDKNAVLSFTLTDEPIYVDLAVSQSKDEAVKLAVVCKDGQMHLCEHVLNGHCKKPLSPSCSVQVASPGSVGDGVPRPVPILAAALTMDKQALLLAYGSGLQPVIERTTLNAGETHVCLVRDIQASLTLRTETTFTKVKTPTVKADAKLLVPGLPGHSAPIKSTPVEMKRKPGSDTKEMSIEERLSVIDLSPAEGRKGVHKGGLPLQTDSFAVLLVQGLESSDSNILNLPSLVSHLGVLYHMIESRVKMFHKLSRLHGKLYLLITQVRLR
ncbi:WD repeat-containing protein 43 [Acipenser ruthenus]|uniref:WD repeat-containing protein 43 n=1 Tax=Acipenser ruthenus TaxID=7906 RepID=A0A444UQ72_ACIRT|nr:WD repeat-containing protein 43 [Acipenser ruthenus]